jgi:nicotinamidase-related amidase
MGRPSRSVSGGRLPAAKVPAMPTGGSPIRLRPADCTVLVVDVQERLLPVIPARDRLITNVAFLLDVAQLLSVPAVATEQYPKGLGRTAPAIAGRLPSGPPEKVTFSCCGAPGLVERLRDGGRTTVVVCGMETHVCVLQTALDLLDAGLRVAVVADAVAGRFDLDHDLALRRMNDAGALVTTAETVAFEWLGTAAAPEFKAVSALVRQRAGATANPPVPDPAHAR